MSQPYNQETVVKKQTNFSVKTRDAAQSENLREAVG